LLICAQKISIAKTLNWKMDFSLKNDGLLAEKTSAGAGNLAAVFADNTELEPQHTFAENSLPGLAWIDGNDLVQSTPQSKPDGVKRLQSQKI
jgi:hypothetical protein